MQRVLGKLGVGFCAVIAGLVLSGGTANATNAPTTSAPETSTTTTLPKPSVTLVGPASETITLAPIHPSLTRYAATFDVLIQNSGTAIARAKLSVVGDPTNVSSDIAIESPKLTFSLRGFAITTIPITIHEPSGKDNNATIELRVLDPKGIPPTFESFKLLRDPSTFYIWFPVALGFLFGVLFFLFRRGLWLGDFGRLKGDQSKKGKKRSQFVYPPGSTWSFGGSWVTVISALGAVLATVLGSTGLISDAFPGVDVQRFLTLNLVLGAAVLAGPLVYSAMSKSTPDGTYGTLLGLVVAASLTLVGVAGQLATTAELVVLSNAGNLEKGGMIIAVAIAIGVLFWYAMGSLDQIARLKKPKTGPVQSRNFFTGI